MAKLLARELVIDGLYICAIIGIVLTSSLIAAQIIDLSLYTYHQYQLVTIILSLIFGVIVGLIVDKIYTKK